MYINFSITSLLSPPSFQTSAHFLHWLSSPTTSSLKNLHLSPLPARSKLVFSINVYIITLSSLSIILNSHFLSINFASFTTFFFLNTSTMDYGVNCYEFRQHSWWVLILSRISRWHWCESEMLCELKMLLNELFLFYYYNVWWLKVISWRWWFLQVVGNVLVCI